MPDLAERGIMSETYVECLVKHNASKVLVALKWILTVIAVVIGVLGLMSSWVILVAALVVGAGAYLLSLKCDLEYEYLYLDKEITIDKITNQTRRKKVEVLEVDRMEIIAPIKSHHLDSYRNRQWKTTDYSIGEERQPDNRFVMYYNGDRKIILSPTPEFLKALRTVAPRKVFAD